jgi:phosphatidate cytidylyltransferase
MSMRQRVPTAIVLLGILFVLVQYAPRPVFFVFCQVFVLGALIEFYNLVARKNLQPQRPLGIACTLLIGLSFYFHEFTFDQALILCFLATAAYFVFAFDTLEKLPAFPSAAGLTLFGALYLGFMLNHLFLLRDVRGPLALYFLFAVIFLGDTGAYLIGKLIGRHKMTPIASPHKTWEGSAGGILFAAGGAIAVRFLVLPDLPILSAVAVGVLVHAAAQISDPMESLFKRAAGIKDSSKVFPGHGGFLDRIDSLILAGPVFYYLTQWFGW